MLQLAGESLMDLSKYDDVGDGPQYAKPLEYDEDDDVVKGSSGSIKNVWE